MQKEELCNKIIDGTNEQQVNADFYFGKENHLMIYNNKNELI